jgi:hypothetical protein
VERLEDRKGAHRGQPVRRLSQSTLESLQRPGGGAILLPLRRAVELPQDALLLSGAIPDRRSPAVPAGDRLETFPVEAAHEFPDTASRAEASPRGGFSESSALLQSQERPRTAYSPGLFAVRTGDLLQQRPLLGHERTQRFGLWASHGDLGRHELRADSGRVIPH